MTSPSLPPLPLPDCRRRPGQQPGITRNRRWGRPRQEEAEETRNLPQSGHKHNEGVALPAPYGERITHSEQHQPHTNEEECYHWVKFQSSLSETETCNFQTVFVKSWLIDSFEPLEGSDEFQGESHKESHVISIRINYVHTYKEYDSGSNVSFCVFSLSTMIQSITYILRKKVKYIVNKKYINRCSIYNLVYSTVQ